ncbi:MAG: GNAT family N-acetyltransferase [Verrucomicrobiales bacterium]|nr:GNAT family N-acetyltransferase [Verrucomicrobiales bacterium]
MIRKAGDEVIRRNEIHPMRQASLRDVGQLVSMMRGFYAEAGYALNLRRAAVSFTALLTDERFGYVFLIQAGDQDVGYLVLTLAYSMEYGGLSATIEDLYVQRPFRGAGLATAALNEARTFCARCGVRGMRVETGSGNEAAQAVYRRIGFARTDRELLTLSLADPTHEV